MKNQSRTITGFSLFLSVLVAGGPAFAEVPRVRDAMPGAEGRMPVGRLPAREVAAPSVPTAEARAAAQTALNGAARFATGSQVQTGGGAVTSRGDGTFSFRGTRAQTSPAFREQLRAAYGGRADEGARAIIAAIGATEADAGNGMTIRVAFTPPTTAGAPGRGTVDDATRTITLGNGGTVRMIESPTATTTVPPQREGDRTPGPPAANGTVFRDGGNTIGNARQYARAGNERLQTGERPVASNGNTARPFSFNGTGAQMSNEMKSNIRAAFRPAADAGDAGAVKLLNAIGWEEGQSGNGDNVRIEFQVPTAGNNRGINTSETSGGTVVLNNGAAFRYLAVESSNPAPAARPLVVGGGGAPAPRGGAVPRPGAGGANPAALQGATNFAIKPAARGAVAGTPPANGAAGGQFQAKFSQLQPAAQQQVRNLVAALGPAAVVLQQKIDNDEPINITVTQAPNGRFSVSAVNADPPAGPAGRNPIGPGGAPAPVAPRAGAAPRGRAGVGRAALGEGRAFIGFMGTNRQAKRTIMPQGNGTINFRGAAARLAGGGTARAILQGMTTNAALPAAFRTALTNALANPRTRIEISFNPRTNTITSVTVGGERANGNFRAPAPAAPAAPAQPRTAVNTAYGTGGRVNVPIPAGLAPAGVTGAVKVQYRNAAGAAVGAPVRAEIVRNGANTSLVIPGAGATPPAGATSFAVQRMGPAPATLLEGNIPATPAGETRFDAPSGPATLAGAAATLQLPAPDGAAIGGAGTNVNITLYDAVGNTVETTGVMGANNTIQMDPTAPELLDVNPADVMGITVTNATNGATASMGIRPTLDRVELSAPATPPAALAAAASNPAVQAAVDPAARGTVIVQNLPNGQIAITGTASQLSPQLRAAVQAQATAEGPASLAQQSLNGGANAPKMTFVITPNEAGVAPALERVTAPQASLAGGDVGRIVNTNGAGLVLVEPGANNQVTVTLPSNQLTNAGRTQAVTAGIALPPGANVTITIDTSVRGRPQIVAPAAAVAPEAGGAVPPAAPPAGPIRSVNLGATLNLIQPGVTGLGVNPTPAALNANLGAQFGQALAQARAIPGLPRGNGSPYRQAVNALVAAGFNTATNTFGPPPAAAPGAPTPRQQIVTATDLLRQLNRRP